MSDHCHSELSKILHFLVCLTGALMLVFPVSRVYQRIDHLRAPRYCSFRRDAYLA
jgi:hypothetical protein